jgi:hypothetical protein
MRTLASKLVGPPGLVVIGASGVLLTSIWFFAARQQVIRATQAAIPGDATPIQARGPDPTTIEIVPIEAVVDGTSAKAKEVIFALRNRGSRPVTVTRVVPSCGRCTVVAMPDPKTIAPGGESTLRVVARAPDVGESRSRINIYHDQAGAAPLVATVLLKGRELEAPTMVQPPRQIVIRGFLGETAEDELRIIARENRDTKPWIEAVESDSPNVSVKLLGIEEAAGPTKATVDRSYRYRITAVLDRRGRLLLALLTTRCASPTGGVAPTAIQVMCDSRASVEAMPDTIFASLAKSDLPREFRIRFRSPRLGHLLELEPAAATATWFEIDTPTAQREGSPFAAEMVVRITDLPDDSASTTSRAVVSIATNAEDCPEVEIPLYVRRRN